MVKKNISKAGTWVNLVNKIVNPFFAQNLDFEPGMAESFANERKSTPNTIIWPDLNLMFFLSLSNGSAINGSKSEFWAKKGFTILFTRFTQVISFSINSFLFYFSCYINVFQPWRTCYFWLVVPSNRLAIFTSRHHSWPCSPWSCTWCIRPVFVAVLQILGKFGTVLIFRLR